MCTLDLYPQYLMQVRAATSMVLAHPYALSSESKSSPMLALSPPAYEVPWEIKCNSECKLRGFSCKVSWEKEEEGKGRMMCMQGRSAVLM